MKFVTPETLSSVMPLFEKFAEKAGFNERMDSFKLFTSLNNGLRKGVSFIVTNEDFTKMLQGRILSPELENKSRQIGINTVWTEVDSDQWVSDAVDFVKGTIGKSNQVELYFINVYPAVKDLYGSLKMEDYETACILV